jgi:hypothetical protein
MEKNLTVTACVPLNDAVERHPDDLGKTSRSGGHLPPVMTLLTLPQKRTNFDFVQSPKSGGGG